MRRMTTKVKLPGDHDLERQESFHIVIVTVGAAAVWFRIGHGCRPASSISGVASL
jgi:hypothetical protein